VIELTLLSALLPQDLRILVVTDTANVPHTVGGKHVLCSAGGVLGSAAGNKFGVAVFDQVIVDAHLVLFGEQGVVKFEAIFL
jgi:hypothetical protein